MSPVNETVTYEEGSAKPVHYWHVPRLIVAWVATLLSAVVIALAPALHSHRFEWMAILLAGGTLLTFILQLGTAQREGFIVRTAASVGGVVLIVTALAGVTLLLSGEF